MYCLVVFEDDDGDKGALVSFYSTLKTLPNLSREFGRHISNRLAALYRGRMRRHCGGTVLGKAHVVAKKDDNVRPTPLLRALFVPLTPSSS